MLGLETEITYKKPASVIAWIIVFGFFGPLVGAIQIVFILVLIQDPSFLEVLPFALISSMVMFIPAAITGLLMYLLKDYIKNKIKVLLFSVLGALVAYLWFLFSLGHKFKHDGFLLIMIIVGYITTLCFTSLFFHRKEESAE